MKNNTIEVADKFMETWEKSNSWNSTYGIHKLMVAYHSHLMAEAEKEVSDEKVYQEMAYGAHYDSYMAGAKWMRSKIFGK